MAIKQLTDFLGRQTLSTGQLAHGILMDPDRSNDEKIAELRELRHARAVHLRKFVQKVLHDFDQEIERLRQSPAIETQTVSQKLDGLLRDRQSFTMYIQVMFEMRTPKAAKSQPE